MRPPRASGGSGTVGACAPGPCSPKSSRVKSPRRFSTIAVRPTRSPVVVNGSVKRVPVSRIPRSRGVDAGRSSAPSSAGVCDEKSERQPSMRASALRRERDEREVAACRCR